MICKECNSCKQIGRAQTQKNREGRKKYYCNHAKIKELKDKWGYPHHGFIGFGEHTYDSPLKMSTSPRWCPIKHKKKGGLYE